MTKIRLTSSPRKSDVFSGRSLMYEFPQVCLYRKLAGHKVGLSVAAAAAIRSGKIHDTKATVVCQQLAPFFYSSQQSVIF